TNLKYISGVQPETIVSLIMDKVEIYSQADSEGKVFWSTEPIPLQCLKIPTPYLGFFNKDMKPIQDNSRILLHFENCLFPPENCEPITVICDRLYKNEKITLVFKDGNVSEK